MPIEQRYSLIDKKHVSDIELPLSGLQLPPEGELATRKEIIYAWLASGYSFPLNQTKYPVRRASNLAVNGYTLMWLGVPIAAVEYAGVIIYAFSNQSLYSIIPIIKTELVAAGYMLVDHLPVTSEEKKTRGGGSKRKYNPQDEYVDEAPAQIIRVASDGHVQIDAPTELESAQPDEYLADDDPFVTGLAEFADT